MYDFRCATRTTAPLRAHAQRAVSADGQRACVAPTGANRQWGAGESIWGSSRAVRRGALVVMILMRIDVISVNKIIFSIDQLLSNAFTLPKNPTLHATAP